MITEYDGDDSLADVLDTTQRVIQMLGADLDNHAQTYGAYQAEIKVQVEFETLLSCLVLLDGFSTLIQERQAKIKESVTSV